MRKLFDILRVNQFCDRSMNSTNWESLHLIVKTFQNHGVLRIVWQNFYVAAIFGESPKDET